MNRIVSFLLTVITSFLLYSCTDPAAVYIYGNIAGKVTEEGSNNAIEGATIEISGVEQSVKTGSNGMFMFEKLPADNYTMYVSKDGYVADSKVITVVASQTTQSDFSLLKNLPEVSPSEVLLNTTKTTASIELKNTRSADMVFNTHTSKPWISVSPTQGTIASKNARILSISVDLTGVDYGEYSESIVINVGESSLSIPIQISYYRPAYIDVISPEQGTSYKMGTVLPISWKSNVGGTVKIELVRNGNVQQSIVSSVDNNTMSNHSWGIPSLAVDSYQICVTSNENPNVSGLSGVFYLSEGPTPPVVSTGEVTSITSSVITIAGTIEDFGKTYTSVSQYGHVYSESNPNPTISDLKHSLGSTNQLLAFSSELVNLKPNTRYYVRAYAENPKGVSYGAAVSVTTKTADGSEPWHPTEPDEAGAVDLGLSVKWAAYNIGASSPESYGDYYAWGETETKADYSEENYPFKHKDSYGLYVYDNPGGQTCISGTEYDPAHKKLGKGWRMPTRKDFIELEDASTVVWTSYNGINGLRVIGPNGNSIFLPASGARNEYGNSYKGRFGYYWSGDVLKDQYSDSNRYAYDYYWSQNSFGTKYNEVGAEFRYCGLPIRPVKE